MPLPDLTGLPDWVGILAYIVLAISIGIGTYLTRVGFMQGKKAPIQQSPAAAEIAAVTLDSAAIKQLAGEAAGLNVVLTELVAVGKELVRATERQADETDRLRDELKETGKHVRDLGNEVAKAKP